jgi:hypothetical protein
MSYTNWYWVGSKVPYDAYLRRRDVSLQGAAPVVSALSDQTRKMVEAAAGVRAEIGEVNRTLDWGFSTMMLQLGAMNETLQKLLKAVKTPAQTAATEQFDIARDCVRRGLFPEALSAIDAALEGNTASPGYKMEWRFHFLKGTLHLGSFDNHDPAILDLAKAEACFLEAARYAMADYPADSARALTAASWAALVQSRGDNAIAERARTHVSRALVVFNNCADSYYQFAKVSAVLGHVDDLQPALFGAFTRCYELVARAFDDGDIVVYPHLNEAFREFIEQRRAWYQGEIARRISLADSVGVRDSNTDGAMLRFRTEAANADSDVIFRNVRQGSSLALSPSAEHAWDDAVRLAVPGFFAARAHSGDSLSRVKALGWSDVEGVVSGQHFRYQAPPFKGYVELHALPVVGSTIQATMWAALNTEGAEGASVPLTHSMQVGSRGVCFEIALSKFHANLGRGWVEYSLGRGVSELGAGVVIIGFRDEIQTVVVFPYGGGRPYLLAPLAACLSPHSIVYSPTGPVEIHHFRRGDLCLTPDGDVRRVLHVTWHRTPSRMTSLVFDDGTRLCVTGNHSVHSEGRWKRVDTLHVGSAVRVHPAGCATVTSICCAGSSDTYNLIVEGGVYVADGVVVHSFTTLRVLRTVLWDFLGARMVPIEAAVLSVVAHVERLRARGAWLLHAAPVNGDPKPRHPGEQRVTPPSLAASTRSR